MDGLRLVTMSEDLSLVMGLERKLSAYCTCQGPRLGPQHPHGSASCGLSFKILSTPGERDAFIRPHTCPAQLKALIILPKEE